MLAGWKDCSKPMSILPTSDRTSRRHDDTRHELLSSQPGRTATATAAMTATATSPHWRIPQHQPASSNVTMKEPDRHHYHLLHHTSVKLLSCHCQRSKAAIGNEAIAPPQLLKYHNSHHRRQCGDGHHRQRQQQRRHNNHERTVAQAHIVHSVRDGIAGQMNVRARSHFTHPHDRPTLHCFPDDAVAKIAQAKWARQQSSLVPRLNMPLCHFPYHVYKYNI
mmetsp:Transcript_18570/g.51639  ORF Transcript_18570/g.51639 Transcript_18570/m.51639 type:complete len:221 (-) Transcript_18570:226-888(-)